MTPHQLLSRVSTTAIADGPVTFARLCRDLGMTDAALRARLSELRGVVEARTVDGVCVVYGRLRNTAHRHAPFGCWPSSHTIDAVVRREVRLAKKRATDARSDKRKTRGEREEWSLAG